MAFSDASGGHPVAHAPLLAVPPVHRYASGGRLGQLTPAAGPTD